MEHIGHHAVQFLGHTFHLDTITMSLVTSAIVILIAFLWTRGIKPLPTSRRQNMVEMLAEAWLSQLESMVGPNGRKAAPIILTLFLYLLIGNWLGLVPGFASPTNDINATLGLAVLMVILSHVLGAKQKGLFKYLHHFVEPYVFFLPINLLEEVTKPITLACRLFGNIFAGEILLAILVLLTPWLIPTVWLGFSVFVGIVQALIFTIMSITYLGNALKEEH